MTPVVTESEKATFHALSRKAGNRVMSRYLDSVSGKVVAGTDISKGYPKAENEYVLLEDDELYAVALDSARTIDEELIAPAN